jgi:glycosyltransferase involved in cell wall biosynthesis
MFWMIINKFYKKDIYSIPWGTMGSNNPELSIVLPCRNEEKAIGFCINNIKNVIARHKLDAEIVVSDSSRDRSHEIARELGARVVKHNKKGYGIACLEGFRAAKGKYLIMVDSDGTYDFEDIPKYLHYMRRGYDFVIGNRFKGKMHYRAMPFSHKYIGNPMLSWILSLFFKVNVGDSHCGMRGLTKKAFEKLELKTTGMEFASEMIIKAGKSRLKIKEFPTNYYKRKGRSKLSSFSDGWRHLRFMLMYAPDYLFLVPGIMLFLLGIFIITAFLFGPIEIFGVTMYTYPTIAGSFFAILGYQIINLGLFAKTYAVSTGFEKKDKMVDALARLINFESGIVLGAGLLVIAILIGLIQLIRWIDQGFPALENNAIMILAFTLSIIAIQTLFSVFFMSILLVNKNGN